MPVALIRSLKQLSIAHRFYLGFLTMFVSFLVIGMIYGISFFIRKAFSMSKSPSHKR